CQQDSHWPTF
nr:immunoglobulin light chain junction region [Macaca mulatta]MOV85001.1 immunoglobulin light chain junction region [Macaca mulatta]